MFTPGTATQSNQNPLVSVIIPAYNAERFIAQTLDSVFAQTYQNYEVVVVDDGSHDRTAAIVRQYSQRDARIQLWQQPNSGVAAARNLAIEKSRGEFIAPLDADDIWFPDNLKLQVECFVQSKDSVGLVYSWSLDIDEKGKPRGTCHAYNIQGDVYSTLLCHDFIGNASSVLIRRSCLEYIGGYNAKFSEDLELYLRIAERYKFQTVPRFLVAYRRHSNGRSYNSVAMIESRSVIWESVRQKYPKFPKALYKLSNSSFYLYLAHQSSSYNNHADTLFWLKKAIKIDFITPPFRLGFYILLIKSISGNIFQKDLKCENNQLQFQDQFNQQSLPVLQEYNLTLNFNEHHIAVRFKVLVGNLLHYCIPRVFGTPQLWKQG